MSLDPNKTYLEWNGTTFPNSSEATFKAPAGSSIDWGDGTIETFNTASTTVNTHTYTDGKSNHIITITGLPIIAFKSFARCTDLTSVTIGKSVTSISGWAFSDCYKLTSVTIPDSVKSIGNGTFYGCNKLASIIIPESVTSIGDSAFFNCTILKTIILFPKTPPSLGPNAIPTTISTIYVQQSSKEAYKTATNWNSFASKIVSDNIYLSFVRFNQKNKEYINGKVDELSTKVAPILSDYVDDTLLGG